MSTLSIPRSLFNYLCLSIFLVNGASTSPGQDVFLTVKYFGFTSLSVALPAGGLVEGTNGALYGLCSAGGDSDKGAVFRLNKDGSGLGFIKSFGASPEGLQPSGTLLLGAEGML